MIRAIKKWLLFTSEYYPTGGGGGGGTAPNTEDNSA